ncbi:hypothetical protein M595_0333 [Lyngbya aestuarii BL J]|uniref:Uncharacterized protein n=1 Tax=Lyngbya aestuarii BL J TaxID=1348334 RepID=U7QR43_9CYAN|nr:hypothetical protein M595_0333 [Lyngbya aestuarii BL J]
MIITRSHPHRENQRAGNDLTTQQLRSPSLNFFGLNNDLRLSFTKADVIGFSPHQL